MIFNLPIYRDFSSGDGISRSNGIICGLFFKYQIPQAFQYFFPFFWALLVKYSSKFDIYVYLRLLVLSVNFVSKIKNKNIYYLQDEQPPKNNLAIYCPQVIRNVLNTNVLTHNSLKETFGIRKWVLWLKKLYKWFLRKDRMIILNPSFLYLKFIKKTNKVTESNEIRFFWQKRK